MRRFLIFLIRVCIELIWIIRNIMFSDRKDLSLYYPVIIFFLTYECYGCYTFFTDSSAVYHTGGM